MLKLLPLWSEWLTENLELNSQLELKYKIKHTAMDGININLQLLTPNSINRFRAKSFSYKEPETLEWIDKLGKDAVLYDVGANIGLFSLYHAKKNACQSYAFEPSVFNLELLTRNISLNNLGEFITIIPVALAEKTYESKLYLSDTKEGGAHNSFGSKVGHDGTSIEPKFEYKCLGFTLDFLVDNLIIKPATIIKIDVDGIEDLILQGATNLLKHPNLKSILIEVNDDFFKLAQSVSNTLEISGFRLVSKNQSDMFKYSAYNKSYNQIWIKHGFL